MSASGSFRCLHARQRLLPFGNDRWIVREIGPTSRLAITRRVTILLAVGFHLRRRQLLLPLLDVGQYIGKPLVLGEDGSLPAGTHRIKR